MTVSLKHAFVSGVADDPTAIATGEVLPSHWDAEHILTQATTRLLGRTTAGTGATEEISVSSPLTFSAGALGIAGSALTKTDDTNVTLTLGGSPATALLAGVSLTLGWTGTLGLSRLAQGTDGQLIVGQTGAAPVYKSMTGAISLSAAGAAALTTSAFANPTASLGLTAVNGAAVTAMRSDAAPALDVTISPTWTGSHVFQTGPTHLFKTSTDSLSGYFGITDALAAGFATGNPGTATYTTSLLPTVMILRSEQINNATTAYTAALTVVSQGYAQNSLGASSSQTQGIISYANKDATSQGDAVALFGQSTHSGSNGTAFGGFFQATNSNNTNSNATAIETGSISSRLSDTPYNPTPASQPAVMGLDIAYGNNAGNFKGGAAIQIRSSSSLKQWDVGIGFMNGSPIATADIQSDTNAVNLWLANTGAHTHGLNWTAATFSSDAIATPGFTVSGAGVTTNTQALAANASGDGIVLQNTTAATSGNQRLSPAIHLIGQGWKTTATAASQQIEWAIEVIPVQDTTNPDNYLNFRSNVNSLGFANKFQINDNHTGGQTSVNFLGVNSTQFSLYVNGANTGVFYADASQVLVGAIANVPTKLYVNNAAVVTLGTGGTVQFNNSSSFSANGSVATAMSSVGPTGSHTTVQEWLTIVNAGGTTRYIPCF